MTIESRMTSLEPLRNIFNLVDDLESLFKTSIQDNDFIIGRKQVLFTFLHELMHAFITNRAPWIHEEVCTEEENDFVDEFVVRVLIDYAIKELNLSEKVNPYYAEYVHHKTDLKNYGFNLGISTYEKLENLWYESYQATLDINGYCSYVLNFYRKNANIHRKSDKRYQKMKRTGNPDHLKMRKQITTNSRGRKNRPTKIST